MTLPSPELQERRRVRFRRGYGTTLRLFLAGGLTAFVLWRSDPRGVLQACAGANVRDIVVAVLLVAADRALMAYRWIVLLCTIPRSDRPPLSVILRIFFVSTFVGTFLPASVGGDAVRAFSLSRRNVETADAVASVFMDRMLGVLSILLMAVVGLFFARDLISDRAVMSSLFIVAAICAVTTVVVFSERAAQLVRALSEAVPGRRLHRIADQLVDAIQRYRHHNRELANVLAGSLGVQFLRIVQCYYLGRALGIAAPFTIYLAFVPLILLVMLLPVTVNGIGTSQAAFVWFFSRVGVGRPEAFSLSVLFVALGVIGNLPGGALYAWGGVGRRAGEVRV